MNSSSEEWKVIPEYPRYEASTLGNIRNTLTKVVLKPCFVQNGYAQVRLSLGSTTNYKVCRVHRLVASAWIPNEENKKTVNHINANKHDNCVNNLEWLTHSEQSLHYVQFLKDTSQTSRRADKYDKNTDNLENEIWKPLDNMPPYLISSKGRIKNGKGQILKGNQTATYIQLKIYKKHVYPHRAVAKAFLESFTNNCVVNHKDGNKKNNCVENLECLTQHENVLHAYNIGANSRRIAVAKYTLDGVFVAEYKSLVQAGKAISKHYTCISNAIKHNGGKLGSFIWKSV